MQTWVFGCDLLPEQLCYWIKISLQLSFLVVDPFLKFSFREAVKVAQQLKALAILPVLSVLRHFVSFVILRH